MTPKEGVTRRRFLQKASAATVLVGTSFDAASYARIAGANERFFLGLIGCGGRGQDQDHEAQARRLRGREEERPAPSLACVARLPRIVGRKRPSFLIT